MEWATASQVGSEVEIKGIRVVCEKMTSITDSRDMDNSNSAVLDKNKKYDRQLRLWGDHGQTALEGAQVCLINATGTGTEILKNLVLPGIGSFVILDNQVAFGQDLGSNFFLTLESIGKKRGQEACELLLELNADVKGSFLNESVQSMLEKNATYFDNFSIVIATDLAEGELLQLAKHLWQANVPLLVCRSYGLIGYLRIVVKEHEVVESHPDNAFEDLRLDKPFPGLVSFMNAIDLGSLSKKDHMHTPYVVVLYKCLEEWKLEHDGEMPKNYKEKNLFKEYIKRKILMKEDGVSEEEENFDEAIRAVNTALVPTHIPQQVQELFEDNCCKNLTKESKAFWVNVRAIKDFTENEGEGCLCLRGSIPDMTSDSERYIQLHNVYREKAKADAELVLQRVQNFLQNLEMPLDSIGESTVQLFCKNSAFLNMIRCRSMQEEYDCKTMQQQLITQELHDVESDMVWYVMLRCADLFREEFKHYPGVDLGDVDFGQLKGCSKKLLADWGINLDTSLDDHLRETCRYGGGEIHSVAAFVGGVAAQEAIKVITRQFIPFNNTILYNATTSKTTTFKL